MTSSGSSPNASAGWTTVSGASTSAAACRGHPRTLSAVPASHRGRATSRRSSDGRNPPARSVSRASSACRASPALYMQDAAHAAPAPRATDVMSRRHLRGTALGAAAGGAVPAAPALCAVVEPARMLLGVRSRIDDRAAVAVTFDDGPHPRGTPATLEVLRGANAVATFFLVGEQVRRRPALACEIVAAGHAVGVHADRHRNLLWLTPGRGRANLARAEATIADAIGTVAPVYRPPYGVLSAAGIRHARARRWEIVLWSRWGRDWRAAATPASVTSEA